MNKWWLCLALPALMLVGCSGGNKEGDNAATGTTGGNAPVAGKKLKIAMIPKGTTHEFWKSVEAGAHKAEGELGVELIWKGPLTENDKDAQIKVVETFTTEKVDAIALAPLDDTALRQPVKEAQDAGIPVGLFDSGLKDAQVVSFVATDNKAAGKMGGTELAKLLGGKGKVILLRYQEGSASTMEREEGFLEAMKENPGIQVVSDNQYAGATLESAQSASENLINRFKGADKMDVDGIFCPNESSTAGMLLALTNAGFAGEVKLVGFDSSEALQKAVHEGTVNGVVVQDPFNMGYLTVKTMVAAIKKEKVETRIDTGAKFVTKENIDTPDIQHVINPLKK